MQWNCFMLLFLLAWCITWHAVQAMFFTPKNTFLHSLKSVPCCSNNSSSLSSQNKERMIGRKIRRKKKVCNSFVSFIKWQEISQISLEWKQYSSLQGNNQSSCSWVCYKAMCGSGSKTPLILNLSTRQSWVLSFMHWPLYLWGKNPWSWCKWFG